MTQRSFCKKCGGRCCNSIPLTSNDIKRIRGAGFKPGYFISEPDTIVQYRWMKCKDIGGKPYCIFWEKECSIYKIRPAICVRYYCVTLRKKYTKKGGEPDGLLN